MGNEKPLLYPNIFQKTAPGVVTFAAFVRKKIDDKWYITRVEFPFYFKQKQKLDTSSMIHEFHRTVYEFIMQTKNDINKFELDKDQRSESERIDEALKIEASRKNHGRNKDGKVETQS